MRSPDWPAADILTNRAFALSVALLLTAQACVVVWGYYLATDDWFIVSGGIGGVFDRQTIGTPAIRPVSIGLARAENALFGIAAPPRLLFHVALHGLAGCLVFAGLLGLGVARRQAGATALLFLAWPLNSEPLAWFHSGHTTLPAAVLILAALAGYIRRWHPVVVQVLLLAALLTRENALMLVAVFAAISWHRHRSLKAMSRDLLPSLVTAGVWLAARVWQVVTSLQTDSSAYLPDSDPLMAAAYVAFHLSVPVHPGAVGAWIWAGITALATAAVLWATRKRLAVPALWAAIWVAPFLLLYVTEDPLFDAAHSGYERRWYHLYLPILGLTWLWACALERRPRVLVVAVVLCLTLQLANAWVWTELGIGARGTRAELARLLEDRAPLIVEFEDHGDALTEVVEHQVLDLPRLFPGQTTPPIFRKKPGEESYIRAVRDAFDYPAWAQVPNPTLMPAAATRYRWDVATRRFVRLPR